MGRLIITMPVVNGRVMCPRCNFKHAVTPAHLGALVECHCGSEFKVAGNISKALRPPNSITVPKPKPPPPRPHYQ